ncbi:Hypothetical predicted protein [Paramuricea clavata]|uniref:Uncharacterized protein n=1 Tax=Paramuricea clavata TaxID=317549 RepID=A0A7D9DNZ3_PARCT|nr:Hypothetical predicted protein [Paramuricea clavata]
MVRGVIEKLPGIKAELVTNQVGWQDWGFADLLKALENWKAIHPVESSSEHNPRTPYNRNHSFFSKDSSTPKGTVTKHVEIYNLEVSNTEGNFVIPVNVTKVDRRNLLSVVNLNYPELISRFQHLQGVNMVETDTKSVLPVHLILGAAEYSRIKTSEPQKNR